MEHLINGSSLGYIAESYAIYFSILLVFLIILMVSCCCGIFCCTCCIGRCTKSNDIPDKSEIFFDFVNYDDIYKKQISTIVNTIRKKIPKTDENKIINDNKDDNKDNDKNNNKKEATMQLSDVNIDNNNDNDADTKKYLYVLYSFDNLSDPKTSLFDSVVTDQYETLEKFIDVMIKTFDPDKTRILLHISSPGGYAYKFEASYTQIMRLRKNGFFVIGLIDDICASGGYMLACACNKIIASEYAKIGSVGVVAQVYNYHKLSQKVGIDEKTFTTGSHKVLFPTGSEYNDGDIKRMNDHLNDTFQIFKEIVTKARNLTKEHQSEIFTANTFYGKKAKEYNLIDEVILNSNDYIENLLAEDSQVYITKRKPYVSYLKSLLNDTKITSFFELMEWIKCISNNITGDKKYSKLYNNDHLHYKFV